MVLNKTTFYRRTISLQDSELADLKSGKFTSIYVTFIGRKSRYRKHPPVWKTNVTDVQSVIESASKKDGTEYWVARFR